MACSQTAKSPCAVRVSGADGALRLPIDGEDSMPSTIAFSQDFFLAPSASKESKEGKDAGGDCKSPAKVARGTRSLHVLMRVRCRASPSLCIAGNLLKARKQDRS